jgi:hypothetical protein
MRAASALLVAVLLTTCAISGTFAKYTSSQTANDSARVAYWGFDNDAAIEFELFKNVYDGATPGTTTVEGKNGEKVIAPGTSNSIAFSFDYAASGGAAAPEVDYKITVEPTINVPAELEANPNFKWTLKEGTNAAQEFDSAAELITEIKKLSGDASGESSYKAGNLPEKLQGNYEIGWIWEFENTTGTDTEKASQDAADTALGNATNLDDVTVTINITATQID